MSDAVGLYERLRETSDEPGPAWGELAPRERAYYRECAKPVIEWEAEINAGLKPRPPML